MIDVTKNLSKELNTKVLFDEEMSKHTTNKIGGRAEFFIEALSLETILGAVKFANQNSLDLTVIGNGSNLLVSDEGINGMVLKLFTRSKEPVILENEITVFSGYPLGRLINLAVGKGLSGLESLVGIPGSIGGAVVMNAGTQLGCIGNLVHWVKILNKRTLTVETLFNNQLNFSYRNSLLQFCDDYILVEVKLVLDFSDPTSLKQKLKEILLTRHSKQPIKFPNSGSIFKNPPNESAGRLIEKVSLKGHTIGDAQISPMHANFIVNLGDAKAKDVIELMNLARKKVYAAYDIILQPEIKLLGGGLKLEEV